MKLPPRSIILYLAILAIALPETLVAIISINNLGLFIIFFLAASGLPLSIASLYGLIRQVNIRMLPLWAKILLVVGGVTQLIFIILIIWAFVALNKFS
jgi:hypothetical protein